GVAVVERAHDGDRAAVLPRVAQEELAGSRHAGHAPRTAQPVAPAAVAALLARNIAASSTGTSRLAPALPSRFTSSTRRISWARKRAIASIRRCARRRSGARLGAGRALSLTTISCSAARTGGTQ